MDESIGDRIKKTAEAMMQNVGDFAQKTGEQLTDLRDMQRLQTRIRELEREKARNRNAMVDLLMRMFDQNTFAEALLRPEYLRIKEIDVEIARLVQERTALATAVKAAPPASDARNSSPGSEE